MVNASLSANIKDLNIQLQDYHIIKSEHAQMAFHLKEENDRVIQKAKNTLHIGFSGTKPNTMAPLVVKQAKADGLVNLN